MSILFLPEIFRNGKPVERSNFVPCYPFDHIRFIAFGSRQNGMAFSFQKHIKWR